MGQSIGTIGTVDCKSCIHSDLGGVFIGTGIGTASADSADSVSADSADTVPVLFDGIGTY